MQILQNEWRKHQREWKRILINKHLINIKLSTLAIAGVDFFEYFCKKKIHIKFKNISESDNYGYCLPWFEGFESGYKLSTENVQNHTK